MKFFGKLLLIILAFIILWTSPSYCKEPYKIGAIFSVTGAASFLGEPEKNTVLMLVEQINKAGGINGHPLEVIIEDSKSDETQAVLAAKKLIEKDKVLAIIGPSTTGESMAVIPITTSAQTPLISVAAGASITQPVKERYWVFKTAQYDTSAVEAIYTYMKKTGIKKVGIITITTSFGDAGRKALLELAPKFGISVVADERYGPKDTDMTTQLVKIKSAGAQAVINWSVGPGQVIVTKNWHALKMGIPLFQSHGWGSKKNIELAGKAAEGVIAPLGRLVIWDKLPDKHPQKALLKKYVTDYEARYKSEPGTFGGHAYDALMIVVDALKNAGPDKKKIRDYIENKIKNWPGTGGIFNMSPNDHCGLDMTAFEMVIVKNGDWEILK
ncbi:MAG: ABC transporter substrate-binding protein [Thermodesulfovibrio sp.]|uniref:ABC transporter substrate-binding protein n=1 Tax=unclassified Thermodesulfovibrio TaxID=2645936 RepID=UPI00083B8BAE|nr:MULTISPECIES: ABC transporter substrate-binding protein [unclassified Thermodesulfovibrio]MDI1471191.1 ABC transporter substrate-binding protein [Thermodesulfovibrio sp. 1176]MDI6715275.1 ABC transporter substrate-binding protein [Thermodesulfovibrio sp.]ODA45050.1 Branched-chain amino acid ABC transporter, amino acid-binding protein [Thermodesulfovibrio sp. N1]